MFAFTFGLSVLTGIVFGLAPALTASKPDLIKALRNSRSSGLMSFGLRSFRGWLVVVELALAVVLLLGAGLLVRSFNKLMAVDLGFDRENVLTFRVSLPRSKYSKPAQTEAFYKDLLQRLNALPGVQTAGTINHSPLQGHGMIAFIGIEGHPPARSKEGSTDRNRRGRRRVFQDVEDTAARRSSIRCARWSGWTKGGDRKPGVCETVFRPTAMHSENESLSVVKSLKVSAAPSSELSGTFDRRASLTKRYRRCTCRLRKCR